MRQPAAWRGPVLSETDEAELARQMQSNIGDFGAVANVRFGSEAAIQLGDNYAGASASAFASRLTTLSAPVGAVF